MAQSRLDYPVLGGAAGAGGMGHGPDDPRDPGRGDHRNQWIIAAAIVAAAILIAGVTYALTRSDGSSTLTLQTTTVPAGVSTTTIPPTTTAPSTTTTTTSTTVTTTTVAPTTTPPPDPQQGLNAIVAQLGPNYATSGVISQGGAQWAAVSHQASQSTPVVDVYRFGPGGWLDQATVPLTADGGAGEVAPAADNATPITVASLSGSTDPDFVIVTAAADSTLTSVVSDATGSWTAVPFDGPNGTAIAVPFGTVVGNQIRAAFNNCDPDCADGTTTYAYFQYSNGAFQQVHS